MKVCIAPKHRIPCPLPCAGCADECDPKYFIEVVTTDCAFCHEPNPESQVRCWNCDERLDDSPLMEPPEPSYDAPTERERVELSGIEDRD